MTQQESRDVLHALSNTRVPPSSKAYYLRYTAGDDFKELARNIESDVIALSTEINGYTPRIIRGPFGVGKTHFLKYLYLRLGENIPNSDDTICSWIDLRQLREVHDFQYLLIKGLSTFEFGFPEGYSYQNILRTTYERLAQAATEGKTLSEPQKRVVVRRTLDKIWETAISVAPIPIPAKFAARLILWKLQQDQEKKRNERFQKNETKTDIENESQQAQQSDFIYDFIKLGEGKSTNNEFDSIIQVLAKESEYDQLVDIILRLLKRAGYKRLVIFVDEMEHISTYEINDAIPNRAERVADILNLFHRLHTKISEQVSKPTGNAYPSVAQIMAMPNSLFENVIKNVDPALHSKLDSHELRLDFVPQASPATDELIKNIWELHREAGFILKSNLNNSSKEIKDALFKKLASAGEPATMRNTIPAIIKIIRDEWIDSRQRI